jgi:hypothetical protein
VRMGKSPPSHARASRTAQSAAESIVQTIHDTSSKYQVQHDVQRMLSDLSSTTSAKIVSKSAANGEKPEQHKAAYDGHCLGL